MAPPHPVAADRVALGSHADDESVASRVRTTASGMCGGRRPRIGALRALL
jgi:hypothetical protein